MDFHRPRYGAKKRKRRWTITDKNLKSGTLLVATPENPNASEGSIGMFLRCYEEIQKNGYAWLNVEILVESHVVCYVLAPPTTFWSTMNERWILAKRKGA
jgi:hypothetical protein